MILNMVMGQAQGSVQFEYTGTYQLLDDGNRNWRLKFLTSGVFTPRERLVIDAFLVGGGGGGSGYDTVKGGGAGGGGGYVLTSKSIVLNENAEYAIVIGAGGASTGLAGGDTTAFGLIAEGGEGPSVYKGGAGGSGGGGAGSEAYQTGYGHGGSDGSDGGTWATAKAVGGIGSGQTTREFGEPSGTLYAGGGAGSRAYYNDVIAPGGEGGGGDSKHDGAENTGGGGGGQRGSGGSGIVVIRNHREASA